VGARELRETKDYLVGQHRLGLESTTSQMMWLGESVLGHGRIVDPDEVALQLTGVTAEEVREAARACLCEGFRALVAVGPVEAAGDELLQAFGSGL
jgi:predicted Zn-dependent peptidase